MQSAWRKMRLRRLHRKQAEAGFRPIPEGAVVVAQGLWNPGDLVFGTDGTLYIAETGVAGGDDSGPPAGEGTPAPGATPVTAPPALIPAQISQISPDGAQSVLTKETGGVGIGVYNGSVYVSSGGGSVGSGVIPQSRRKHRARG